MKYAKVIDHTADVGLEVFGSRLPELFEAAADGLFSLQSNVDDVEPQEKRIVTVEGSDLPDLLVTWLSELTYLHETEGLLFRSATVTRLDEEAGHLEAEVAGEPYDSARHSIRAAIKAVTYHDLNIRPTSYHGTKGYAARIILDV
ncbi:archease [Planctomycetota bacterium]